MPDEFLIEDLDTGMKLQVAGDEPPSQDDAHELMESERRELLNSITVKEGNKVMLDVGPLEKIRKVSDTVEEIQRVRDVKMKALGTVDAWQSSLIKQGKKVTDKMFQDRLKMETEKLMSNPPPSNPNTTETILSNVPNNSLLILSHGSQAGGLYTESGHKFTLNNVAALLGEKTNSINNVINTACFSGRCSPNDYQALFPNVTNIVQTPTNVLNTVSIPKFKTGEFFGGQAKAEQWLNIDGQWKEINQTNGE